MKTINNITQTTQLKTLTRGQVFTVIDIDSEFDCGLFFLVGEAYNVKTKKTRYSIFDLNNNILYYEYNEDLKVKVFPDAYLTLERKS